MDDYQTQEIKYIVVMFLGETGQEKRRKSSNSTPVSFKYSDTAWKFGMFFFKNTCKKNSSPDICDFVKGLTKHVEKNICETCFQSKI